MQKSKIDRIDDDIIYFDTTIQNNSSNSIVCEFSQIRGQSILKNSEEYNMSIVRFKVPTSEIPIFNFQPQPKYVNNILTNPNPNLGIYSITYSYGGIDHQVYLEYQSQETIGPPNNWTLINESNYQYYAIYSYRSFMNMINQALQKGFYYCQNTAPFNTSPTITNGAQAPFLSYNSDTQLFSFNASTFFSSDYVGAPTLEIYFNHPLSDYFSGFLYKYENVTINGKHNRVLIKDVGNNTFSRGAPQLNSFLWQSIQTYSLNDICSFNDVNYVSITLGPNLGNQPDISPGDWTAIPLINNIGLWQITTAYAIGATVIGPDLQYYTSLIGGNIGINPTSSPQAPSAWILSNKFIIFSMVQEYTTLYRWETFTNLQFTSSVLPVNLQNQGSNLITDVANSGSAQTSTAQLPILTDFDPLLDQGVLNRNYLQYNTSGPYRLININGRYDFNNFNYQVYWIDQYSNAYKLFMDRSTTANVKFMFQKKGYRS